MSDGSFIDLRLNRETVDHNESFWPSFTDIMTVVVMIFLMAMVVQLLRNMELVKELQSTVEAEREAAELARATSVEKESAIRQFEETQRLLEATQARLAAASADNRNLSEELGAVKRERQQLTDANQTLESSLSIAQTNLSETRVALDQTQDERDRLRTDLQQAQTQVSQLDHARRTLEAERNQFRASLEQSQVEAAELAQARQTLEAERAQLTVTLEQAQTEASDLARTKRTLEADLASTRSRVASLETESDAKTAQLADAQREISRIQDLLQESRAETERRERVIEEQYASVESLTAERTRLAQEAQSLSNQLESLREQIAAAQSELVSTRSQLASSQKQLATLEEDYTAQQTELQNAQQQIQVTDLRLAELQGEYDSLHVKYDKLVKPARSASNKYVVEVRYSKSGGTHRIQYREPGVETFREMSRAELDQRLTQLSNEKPDELYVKVIIPDGSGLSYSEAWRFTSEMHTKYDYYFREQ